MGGGHVSRPDFGMPQPDPAHPLTEFYCLLQRALDREGVFALPALYAQFRAPARRIYADEAADFLTLSPDEEAGSARLLAPALAGGFADSKPLQILAPQMAERCFEPIKWHVRTLLKDLDTAVKLSREQGSATPMSGLAAQLMRMHGSQGYLDRDPATLIDLFQESIS